MTTSISKAIFEDMATALEDIIPCKQPDPAQSAGMKEAVSQLEGRIAGLKMKERRALRLKAYDGKRQRDIAKIMNLPIGSVACLISRARIKVQDNVMEEFCL